MVTTARRSEARASKSRDAGMRNIDFSPTARGVKGRFVDDRAPAPLESARARPPRQRKHHPRRSSTMANLRLMPAAGGGPVEVAKDQTLVGRDPTSDVL